MDIHKLIAAISPETYCRPELARQVRRRLQEMNTVSPPETVLQAAVTAESKPANLIPLERLEEMDPFDCPGLKSPRAKSHFSRDAMAESIEAFYFSILNPLERLEGWQVFKLVDEFQASLLATPFADLAEQQTRIQRSLFEGLEAVHKLTQEVMDGIRRLEESEPVPQPPHPAAPGLSRESALSVVELERARLQSQLALLKLRVAAIRPWLDSRHLTPSQAKPTAALVNPFNSAVFQVILLAFGPDVMSEAVQTGRLPPWMQRKVRRSYRPVLLLEFQFRARPHRSRSQGYAYRGQADVNMTSYGLHDGELDLLRQAVETTQLQESLRLGIGQAAVAVDDLVRRVEQRLHIPSTPATSELQEDNNPFTALGSLLKTLVHWMSGASSDGTPPPQRT